MKKTLLIAVVLAIVLAMVAAVPPSLTHVVLTATSLQNVGSTAAAKSNVTASVNVKASAGNVYGLYALNGAASTCWVQLINSASAGTLGTGVVASFPLPASTTQPIYIPLNTPVGGFSNGIAIGIATTATGNTACGTGGNATVIYQ